MAVADAEFGVGQACRDICMHLHHTISSTELQVWKYEDASWAEQGLDALLQGPRLADR